MNLMSLLLDSDNESAISQLSKNFGLDTEDTRRVMAGLAPSLSIGLKKGTTKPNGLESLARALSKGNHQRYLDDPSRLDQPDSVAEGNAILGHLFGSKEVSRNVAAHAAANSGVNSDIIKKMLPMVAALAMGALSKRTDGGRALGAASTGSQTAPDLLTRLLDSDGDGSIADDVLNLAKKFF